MLAREDIYPAATHRNKITTLHTSLYTRDNFFFTFLQKALNLIH